MCFFDFPTNYTEIETKNRFFNCILIFCVQHLILRIVGLWESPRMHTHPIDFPLQMWMLLFWLLPEHNVTPVLSMGDDVALYATNQPWLEHKMPPSSATRYAYRDTSGPILLVFLNLPRSCRHAKYGKWLGVGVCGTLVGLGLGNTVQCRMRGTGVGLLEWCLRLMWWRAM